MIECTRSFNIDPVVIKEYQSMIGAEMVKFVVTGKITDWKIIFNYNDSGNISDLPTILAINTNENNQTIRDTVQRELMTIEKSILWDLDINKYDFEKSAGGIKLVFSDEELKEFNLVK